MHPQFLTLDNGLKVVFIDTKTFPTLTTLLLVSAGSRFENEKNNGIAHFLEHMFYKGSKKYPNPHIISSTIEGFGGHWNAFTAKDYTGYYVKAANYHFDKVVDLLSDILLHPLLQEEEIAKEKGVIVEEINMYEDMPQNKVSELFENLMYENNPLGRDIVGTKKTVRSFKRSDFSDYLGRYYAPKNAVLVVAGGFEKGKDYKKIIEASFGHWTGEAKALDSLEVNETQTGPRQLIFHKATEQAHFCFGFRTFSFFDKRKYALSVLSTILGGGASSKLFSEVREKRGLCYYISTGRQHYHDVGNLVTQAGVPKEIGKIKEAVAATWAEHKKMAGGQISNDELVRAKEMIKGRFLLSMEDSFNVAHHYGKKKLLENTSEEPGEIMARIEKVTRDEIVALALEIFQPERINLSLIGPVDEKDINIQSLL